MVKDLIRLQLLEQLNAILLDKTNHKVQVIVDCSDYYKSELESISKIKYELPIINAFALEIDKNKLQSLFSIEGVIKVENDDCLAAQSIETSENIHNDYYEENSHLGEEIGVAILDTGIYPHKDFIHSNRLIGFKDFINNKENPYDDNGHGTHVAGIIGGDGTESKGQYVGIAQKSNLIGVKVLGADGSGNISDVLAGIQWVFDHKERYNIKIINMSVGMSDIEGEDSLLIKGVDTAWENGFFVICAAGNNGPKRFSITTPGISRRVITVGAYESENEQLDYKKSHFSSRGPTKNCIMKPEIIAPGTAIISCSSDITYKGDVDSLSADEVGYNIKSGTSMATPVISGIAAKLLSDFDEISNKDFKIALKMTANKVGHRPYQEGWGLVDVEGLYKYFIKNKHALKKLK